MIAGSVTDFTVFSPHEERLSNLVQEFPELANPITEYLQAKPDDSFAEGRLKNSLEGIIAGGLAEPLTRSLRLLKYARIKITGTEVRAKVHHKIEAVEVELKKLDLNNTGNNQIINGYEHLELSDRHLLDRLSIPKATGNSLFTGTRAEALADMPNCANVKALTNHKYQYRLRVGNYRVF
ncbi:hypothetical protein J3U14_10860 [Gilliamella sp. B3801]|nr:hypothetical protein [Gilliamella sp. B3801]MCX8589007.1 hypothetical protein [Gilliamella sp. B3801]